MGNIAQMRQGGQEAESRERQGQGCGAAEAGEEVPRTREGSQESRRDAGRRGGHPRVK